MASDKDYENKSKLVLRDEDNTEGESGKGGRVEFREFVANTAGMRDDLLSPEERKRLLAVHSDLHEARVENQKKLRDKRQAYREGKISNETYRQALSNQGYETHPLSNEAQFSGSRDSQVNEVPGHDHAAQTNNDEREELRKKYAPEFTPKPTPPKPSPYNR